MRSANYSHRLFHFQTMNHFHNHPMIGSSEVSDIWTNFVISETVRVEIPSRWVVDNAGCRSSSNFGL